MRPGIPTPKGNSFTLLEMLGVMAVMAILAGVAVPPMLRTLQNVQTVNEDKNLEEIARAFAEAVREGEIPNPNSPASSTNLLSRGWVDILAPYTSLPRDALRFVYPDRPNTERRYYLIHPPSLYPQPATGWTTNNWPNISTSFALFVSSSKPDYLLACPTNGSAVSSWPNSATALDWLKNTWIKRPSNGIYSATNTEIVGLVENAGSLTWTNQGQFLHVKAIPLTTVLSQVQIQNNAASENVGFSVGGPTTYPLANGGSTNVWYLRGTRVGVAVSNAPPNQTTFFPHNSSASVQLNSSSNWVITN